MKRDYGIYQVALKLLLRKGNEILFLKCVPSGNWDLPGGRIDNVESKVPLKKILAREVREELGRKVKYRLGSPAFQFRRKAKMKGVYNFLTVYEAEYLGGDIELSHEHSSYEWINPKTYKFKKKDFFNKEEFQAHIDYFKI
ncbi:NUDIX domain-containing protein [Patescibacteria group bacterium]|nr:NUDIX domain-containing protein [Patescibacteria group bacterium]